MASGLQCPECGHVHPAGLPEIAKGDATFRCYGCYRMLSVPEGWNGRPAPRPTAPPVAPTEDAPPGAGTRDARSARLAGRGRTLTGSTGAPPVDLPTQMVPSAAASAEPAGAVKRPPVGWMPSRRTGRPVLPRAIRAPVWAAAFGLGLMITAFVLRKMGILSVNAVIDLYAGTGLGRFGILLLLLPMWAALSATLAHLSLEAITKRRQQSTPPPRPPAPTPSPR